MAPGSPDGEEIKPFLLKTYALVQEPGTDAIIAWAPSGDHFVVHNPEAFANQVLPANFTHNNFSSFIRQLNTYGFRKVETDKWSFGHEFFKRGQQPLLAKIQRKRGGSSGRARGGSAGGATEDADADADFTVDDSLTALMDPHASTAALTDGVAGARGAATAEPAASMVMAEIIQMSQQQAGMIAQVKALQAALHETREAQHLTRATIHKVVGFLQHVHNPQGESEGVYLEGPGLESSLPPTKRPRRVLQLMDESGGDASQDLDAFPEVAFAPMPASTSGPEVPLSFKPETVGLSRQISQQLSVSDLDSIDIVAVLDLLSGIEQEASIVSDEVVTQPPLDADAEIRYVTDNI
mmetsp:Transcript_28882/g.67675  ORF Transcript_28882/g.67675 Transcript_28882/m.67675 type:complete len:352 (+) Transcript_28882:139-1194(+)